MSTYPRCGALLKHYVKMKLTPALQGIQDWAEELMCWEEKVEEGANLLEFFARWTEFLYLDNRDLMQQLHSEAARENSVAVAYFTPASSTFYCTSANQRFDLTFAVLVIRGMMLSARPAVAASVPLPVNRALLSWMEDLLGHFPMSETDVQPTLTGARDARYIQCKLEALKALESWRHE